jgi:hypothetical protein
MKFNVLKNKSFYLIILFALSFVTAFGWGDLVDGNLIQFDDNGAWCWYQDERAVIDTAGGKLIITSDASGNGVGGPPRDGDVEAVIFDLQSMTSQRAILREGDPVYFYCDDHHVPGLLVRPDGKYTAFYAAHFGLKSSFFRVYDAGTWGSEYEFSWDDSIPGGSNFQTTYSNLYYLSDEGRMYNFARGNNKSPNFMYSDDGGDQWTYGGQLSQGGGVGYNNGYYKYWGNGVDRIDFICTEYHPRDYNTSIYHGYIQNGNVYNSFNVEVDTSIYDASFIPTTANFTTVFAANTVLNSYTMTNCWNDDVMRYEDGTIAAIISARTGGSSSDPDHAFIYCRFDGSEWKSTYLVNAGKKMYNPEEDYVGLGALNPNDPNTIYISTPYDPRDDLTFLGVREIFKGVTSDSGATWDWTPVTLRSECDNFRPIVPAWDENNTALLWWRGTYYAAQSYDAAVVGIFESVSDSVVQMNYVDADLNNTFLADGSFLFASGPDSLPGPADNQWHWRTTFGNGGTVLTSAEIGEENAPVIKTQLTGIEEGTYDVWVNFWANPEADWRIEAGLHPDSMQIFRQMACKQVMDTYHKDSLVLTGGGNTFLYQAYLGRVQFLTGDTLDVFVDDEAIETGTENNNVSDVCRSWYDGISYAHPGKHTGDISVVVLPDEEEFPVGFKLGGNHPNPFSSSTNINFVLSSRAHVNLSVFNMLGQKVATLMNQEVDVGYHDLRWDAQNIPSGVYFLRMTVGNNSDTKKMIAIK